MKKMSQKLEEIAKSAFSLESYVPVVLTGVALGLAGRGIDGLVPNEMVSDGTIETGVAGALPLLYVVNGGLNCIFRDDRGIYDLLAWGSYGLGVSIAYSDKIYRMVENTF
jgi:hypothetical protein